MSYQIPKGWQLVRHGVPEEEEYVLLHNDKVAKYKTLKKRAVRKDGARLVHIILAADKSMYVPYSNKDFPVQMLGQVLVSEDKKCLLTGCSNTGVTMGGYGFTYGELLRDWKKLDGTPVGILADDGTAEDDYDEPECGFCMDEGCSQCG